MTGLLDRLAHHQGRIVPRFAATRKLWAWHDGREDWAAIPVISINKKPLHPCQDERRGIPQREASA